MIPHPSNRHAGFGRPPGGGVGRGYPMPAGQFQQGAQPQGVTPGGIFKKLALAGVLVACLCGGFSVQVIGRLFVADFLMPVALAVVVIWPATRAYLREHWVEVAVLLLFPFVGLVWDFINQTHPSLYLRGFARNLVFVLAAVSFMGMASRASKGAIIALFVALALAFPIGALVQTPVSGLSVVAFMKYLGGWSLALFVVALMARFLPPAVTGVLMLPLGVAIALGASYRSFGAVVALAGGLAITRRIWAQLPRTGVICAILILPMVTGGFLINMLQSDYIPAELRKTWEYSNYQRLDMAADAWKGFLEAPVLGNGSWAHAVKYTDPNQPNMLLGVHSFVLQFAFEYGLLGLAFGCWLVFLGAAGMTDFLRTGPGEEERWIPVHLLITANFIYAVLMSPMGGYERILAGAALGIALQQIHTRSARVVRP